MLQRSCYRQVETTTVKRKSAFAEGYRKPYMAYNKMIQQIDTNVTA
jgi:hypothetical protein